MWSSQVDDSVSLESLEHKELMNRIRKTLYYGGLKMPKCKVFTKPMTDFVVEESGLQAEVLGQIKASPCSLILALIYLDVLKELDPQYLHRIPSTELLLVAMMVSTKFYSGYDEDLYLADWADYGHITVDRLKELELEFLSAMDWKIYVSNQTFFKKLKDLEQILAEKEINQRGGLLTYTELCTLMPSIEIIRKAISYSCLLAVSYTAGVIAICSAFFVATQVPGSYLYQGSTTSNATTTTAVTPTPVENITTDIMPEAVECRPGGAGKCGNNMTELEQRLILNGVEWDPVSNADDDGKRIHIHRGTDYWSDISRLNDTDGKHMNGESHSGVELSHMESLAHSIIRKSVNDSVIDITEWAPYRTNNNDLSFLSYLWLKFL